MTNQPQPEPTPGDEPSAALPDAVASPPDHSTVLDRLSGSEPDLVGDLAELEDVQRQLAARLQESET